MLNISRSWIYFYIPKDNKIHVYDSTTKSLLKKIIMRANSSIHKIHCFTKDPLRELVIWLF